MKPAKLKTSTTSTGYLFLMPFIIGFLLFGLYPVVNTFTLSFTNTTLMSRNSEFIGLENYTRLFADDVFIRAVGNTWLLWILNFVPQIGIAMLLAVLFTSARLKIKGTGGWRAIFFLPNLMMPAAVAALFAALFAYYGRREPIPGQGRNLERSHAVVGVAGRGAWIGDFHPVVDVVWAIHDHLDGRYDLDPHFPL